MEEEREENLTEVQQLLKTYGFTKEQYDKCASFTDIHTALEFIENLDGLSDYEVKQDEQQDVGNSADNEKESDNSKDIDSEGERGEGSNDDGLNETEMEVQNFQDEDEAESEAVAVSLQEAEKGVRFERVPKPDTERVAGHALGSHRDYHSDHDLYLAIENSINDQKPSSIQDKKRKEGIPVGLMRTQTSYLNPFIQAIYNFSILRDSFLEIPTETDLPSYVIQNVLIEFQNLLGLLHFSERKYVESTPLLNKIIQIGRYIDPNERNNPIELQNAIFEKLIHSIEGIINERKEKAKEEKEKESEDQNKEIAEIQQIFQQLTVHPIFNPITKYFGGEITQTTIQNDQESSKTNPFTSITVNPKQGELILSLLDYSLTETQHSFFSKLPEILLIDIDRVIRYVGDRNINETLFDHQPFTFPKVLHIDRFMESNRKETIARQSIINDLKTQQTDLKSNLRKYSHYNGNTIGIDQLIKGTIQFLNESKNNLIYKQDDYDDDEYNSNIQHFNNAIEQLSNEYDQVSDEMMSYMDCIDQLQQTIDSKYEDMTDNQYNLYAVLVHEGPADMGSSWVFIYNINEDKWYKFYDSSVNIVSEEVVMEESSGKNNNNIVDEHNKTSAYSLIYIKSEHFLKTISHNSEEEISDVSKKYSNSRINPNVIKFVKDHNDEFQKEIDEIERRRMIAHESVLDKFKRLLIEKEREFENSFTNNSSPPNLQSFHHFLMSIDHRAVLQYEFADKVHRQLCANIPLRENDDSEFRAAIAKDFPLIANVNEIAYQTSSIRDIYSICVDAIGYLSESMKLWRKQDYLNSAMFLFHGLNKENKINIHTMKREAEFVQIAHIVLVSLSNHAKSLLLEDGNLNDSLEQFTIAGIVASKLLTYNNIIMDLKAIWESVNPCEHYKSAQYFICLNQLYNTRTPINFDLKEREFKRRDNEAMWRRFLSQKAKFMLAVQTSQSQTPSNISA